MVAGRWAKRALALLGCFVMLVAPGCGEQAPEERTETQGGDDYRLVAAEGGTDVEVRAGAQIDLTVYLYDAQTNDAVSGEMIEFEVVDGPDEGMPGLQVGQVQTEDDGGATNQLVAQMVQERWQVRARMADESKSANVVDFQVTVVPDDIGRLDVEVVNASTGIMELTDVELYVYPSQQLTCDWFAPLAPTEETYVVEEFVPFLEDGLEVVTFDEIAAGQSYTATAVARGDEGQIAAGGCRENLHIEPDQTTETSLILQLIPLNPTGVYDVESFWDFEEALAESGAAGSTIVTVLGIAEDPGEAIYDVIIDQLANWLGGTLSSGLDTLLSATGLDETFQDWIDERIENSETLSQIVQGLKDLREVVTNLHVHSELSIGKLSQDFEFRGQDNWIGITLYWSYLCDQGADDPEYPECAEIELRSGDEAFDELGTISSTWDGRVVNYNELQVDQHTIGLRYGRLILYVLEQIILPTVTDGEAESLEDGFNHFFGCDAIADFVSGNHDDLEVDEDAEDAAEEDANCVDDDGLEEPGRCLPWTSLCLCWSTAYGWCSTAVSSVFGLADILLQGLEFDLGIQLGGEARLIEETSDGVVDRIDDGFYQGIITNADEGDDPISSSFEALWSAERSEAPPGM